MHIVYYNKSDFHFEVCMQLHAYLSYLILPSFYCVLNPLGKACIT